MKKLLMIVAVVLGLGFVFLSIVYWRTPANMLPSYLPGYNPTMMTPHIKHAIGAFIVALALFVFAWFQGGTKKS